MKFSEEQRAAFEEAARPLMQFLTQNCHPHVTVIVHSGRAILLEGLITASAKPFADAEEISR